MTDGIKYPRGVPVNDAFGDNIVFFPRHKIGLVVALTEWSIEKLKYVSTRYCLMPWEQITNPRHKFAAYMRLHKENPSTAEAIMSDLKPALVEYKMNKFAEQHILQILKNLDPDWADYFLTAEDAAKHHQRADPANWERAVKDLP